MSDISQICVDMDGVLCDFVLSAVKLHAPANVGDVYLSWPAGEYSMERVLGCSTNEFWKPIHDGGAEFWANIPAFGWHQKLMVLCRQYAPTTILTSPSKHGTSLAGKLDWLHRHYGSNFRDFLMGPNKHFCARPGAVLIDDCDANCEKFEAHGGRAICFPQQWNKNHGIADPYEYTARKLAEYAGH